MDLKFWKMCYTEFYKTDYSSTGRRFFKFG